MTLDTPDRRFDEEREGADWAARKFFSPDDLRMSPEEYAARRGHTFGCFSFHRFRYRDPALGVWVRGVGEILFTEGELERCQQRFLSLEEMAEVRRQEAEDF